jgi:uncharacterized protein
MDIRGEHRRIVQRAPHRFAGRRETMLAACIPGCQKLEQISPTLIEATIVAQLGPVKAPFGTRIELRDLDPPRGYTLVGEGKSAAAGFGKGEARVTLEERDGATVLVYVAELKIGGKIAQVGARLLEGTTKQLAEQFFTKFAEHFPQAPGTAVAPPAPARAPSSLHRILLWIAILTGLIALGFWLTAH